MKRGDGEGLEPLDGGPDRRFFRYRLPEELDARLRKAGFTILERQLVASGAVH